MVTERPFICLDPMVCDGKPTIGLSRLYVQVIAEAWWYGAFKETTIYLNWPACKGRAELLLACWWMARYGTRIWRKRWGAWLKTVEGALWAGNHDVALPPHRLVAKE